LDLKYFLENIFWKLVFCVEILYLRILNLFFQFDSLMKKLVILTGAGMSAESGISTFRDSKGLWNNYPVEQVATPEGFEANPQLVLDFYNYRRRELFTVEPNAGHKGLAALEKFFEVQIITQNVDNLHERAGSSNVLHLHGELMKSCSVKNKNKAFDIPPEQPDINLGDMAPDGGQLRPFIVWFGEAVPKIEEAIDYIISADRFVVIGTSLNVYPAAGLLHYYKSAQPIFLIDPKPVTTYRKDIEFIQTGASEGVELLTARLKTII
jgi:NAD-dependent deacetylase